MLLKSVANMTCPHVWGRAAHVVRQVGVFSQIIARGKPCKRFFVNNAERRKFPNFLALGGIDFRRGRLNLAITFAFL